MANDELLILSKEEAVSVEYLFSTLSLADSNRQAFRALEMLFRLQASRRLRFPRIEISQIDEKKHQFRRVVTPRIEKDIAEVCFRNDKSVVGLYDRTLYELVSQVRAIQPLHVMEEPTLVIDQQAYLFSMFAYTYLVLGRE